jgi:hypothetical protein
MGSGEAADTIKWLRVLERGSILVKLIIEQRCGLFVDIDSRGICVVADSQCVYKIEISLLESS